MKLPEGFEVVKRRWLAQRNDMGRDWCILPCLQGKDGELLLQRLDPSHLYYPDFLEPKVVKPYELISGQEPHDCHFKDEEAQELMDALWSAGLRPSHHAIRIAAR